MVTIIIKCERGRRRYYYTREGNARNVKVFLPNAKLSVNRVIKNTGGTYLFIPSGWPTRCRVTTVVAERKRAISLPTPCLRKTNRPLRRKLALYIYVCILAKTSDDVFCSSPISAWKKTRFFVNIFPLKRSFYVRLRKTTTPNTISSLIEAAVIDYLLSSEFRVVKKRKTIHEPRINISF